MAEATLYEKSGKASGKVKINDAVFGARVNERLLHLVVTAYAGNVRRGTHATKTRANVRGGGRKPWRQKGTGRARHGSRRSPIWRGGGVVFGPHPRSYQTSLANGMKQSALTWVRVSLVNVQKIKSYNLFLTPKMTGILCILKTRTILLRCCVCR